MSSQEGGLAPAVEMDDATRTVRVRNDFDAMERVLGGQNTEAALVGAEAKEFHFDAVFPGTAEQRDVFLQVGLPVLRECLKGFNGTILAYGQTGSGKTHSLLHQGQKGSDAGLLPRLIASLFLQITNDSANVYTVEAAAVQVYNEQIDDLLHPDHQSGGGSNLNVQNGGVVPGLTWLKCTRPETMMDVFTRARSNVVYAETKMNKASSRSHALFQVRLTKRQRAFAAVETGGAPQRMESIQARLCVVDLAGSERVKKSGVEGAHFKEATAINRSLLAFGNVVSALAAKKAHVPLRDSKLTRILDGSIGGNCRTALLVCASPAAENVAETVSTFDFASRAMRVEVNAKVNSTMVEVSAAALLADLSNDVEHLGGVPINTEVEALRRQSNEDAEFAKTQARKHQDLAAEAESQAKLMKQLAESAEQKGRKFQEEAQTLRQMQETTKSDADKLRKAVDQAKGEAREWEAKAQTKAREAEELRRATDAAEKRAVEWKVKAEARAREVEEARKSQAKESTAEAQRQRDGAKHAEILAKEEAEKAEERRKEAFDRAERAEGRAEAAERELSELRAHVGCSSAQAEAERSQAQVRVAAAEDLVVAERRKTSQALVAGAKQVESLRAQHEEALQSNQRLEAEVARCTAELKAREMTLDDARRALEVVRAEMEEKQRSLRLGLRQEIEAARQEHTALVDRLQKEKDAALEAAQASLDVEKERQKQVVESCDESLRRQAGKWAEERTELEAMSAAALDAQRSGFEERLATGKAEFEVRYSSLEREAEAKRGELVQQLGQVQSELERSEARWSEEKESAVREAWEEGNAQQRKLAAAFKAARHIKDAKQSELLEAHNHLADRFAKRESREDDIFEMQRQRSALEQQSQTLRHRECELKGIALELQNRDETDRIFGGGVPRHGKSLPGKKLGDTRRFVDRDRDSRHGVPRRSSSHHSSNWSRSLSADRRTPLSPLSCR